MNKHFIRKHSYELLGCEFPICSTSKDAMNHDDQMVSRGKVRAVTTPHIAASVNRFRGANAVLEGSILYGSVLHKSCFEFHSDRFLSDQMHLNLSSRQSEKVRTRDLS
uniref:Putative lipase ROG1 isoform X2 n=1 Tax=Rhizophora mucronata TaxID=61149 RepID=A0A2P2Q566_RHIMU